MVPIKRIAISLVGAALGTIVGLFASFLGAGNPALIAGGIVGAVLPHLILGRPGQ